MIKKFWDSGGGCTAVYGKYTKIWWIVYFKMINFMICELSISNLKSDETKIIFGGNIKFDISMFWII